MREPAEDAPSPFPDGEDRANPSTTAGDAGPSAGASTTPPDRIGNEDGPTTVNPSLDTTAVGTSSGSEGEANLNDAWLVERARHGDHAAFAVLVRRYERKLVRVLARLVRDPELARDLAQETFWRVYSRLDRFDSARRFGPWLFRVGVNLGLDQLRRTKGEPPPPASIDRSYDDGRTPFDPPDPDPRVQAELAQEVQFILAQMPVSYRTILVLRDLEGFSSSEVAAIVGRREATVRWRLSKAREKFRTIWERRQDAAQEAATDGRRPL
jgi:RNA polymerase sigma-70 factor (ECF subfamily)